MSETYFVKRHWRLLLNIATIAALLVLGFAIRDQLVSTFHNLTQVKAWLLLLMIPLEVLNYHAQAKLYQRLFTAVDERVSYGGMVRLALELTFVGHVFPSGGVSAISYFGFKMRRSGVRLTKATLVQTMKFMLLFLSFEPLLLFGVFVLALNGRIGNLIILIAGLLTMLVLCSTVAFIYIIGSQRRIHNFLTAMTRLLNRLIRVVRREHPETINIARARETFEDLHQDYLLLKSRPGELRRAFLWALVANATEVAVVYVVYIAFGTYINVGAVILAYAVANFAGLISVLPGGVGVYEAMMTGVLVTAGVPLRLSFPVTVTYHVLNTLLQVPLGYVLYHLTLYGRRDSDGEPS